MDDSAKPIPEDYRMLALQLTYAWEAMSRAYAMIDWLISATQPPNQIQESERHLYLAGLTGFVASYARPFKKSNGLDKIIHGRIFKDLGRAQDEQILNESHHNILLVRDKILAHRDLKLKLNDDRSGGTITSGDIRIQLDGDGYTWTTDYLNVRAEYLPYWKRLVEARLVQLEVAKKEVARGLLENMAAENISSDPKTEETG